MLPRGMELVLLLGREPLAPPTRCVGRCVVSISLPFSFVVVALAFPLAVVPPVFGGIVVEVGGHENERCARQGRMTVTV